MSVRFLEEGVKDAVLLVESDAHLVVEFHLIDRTAHDVGSEIDAGNAIEPHPRDDIRHLEVLDPGLMVYREGLDLARPRNRGRRDVFRLAMPAQDLGRMGKFAAVAAFDDVELALRAAGPEGAVDAVEFRPGPGWRCHNYVSSQDFWR